MKLFINDLKQYTARSRWLSFQAVRMFKHLLPPQFSSYFHYLQDHECTRHLSEDRLTSSWFCEGLLLVFALILKSCTICMQPLNKSFGYTNVKSAYELISHFLVIIAVSLFAITSHQWHSCDSATVSR